MHDLIEHPSVLLIPCGASQALCVAWRQQHCRRAALHRKTGRRRRRLQPALRDQAHSQAHRRRRAATARLPARQLPYQALLLLLQRAVLPRNICAHSEPRLLELRKQAAPHGKLLPRPALPRPRRHVRARHRALQHAPQHGARVERGHEREEVRGGCGGGGAPCGVRVRGGAEVGGVSGAAQLIGEVVEQVECAAAGRRGGGITEQAIAPALRADGWALAIQRDVRRARRQRVCERVVPRGPCDLRYDRPV